METFFLFGCYFPLAGSLTLVVLSGAYGPMLPEEKKKRRRRTDPYSSRSHKKMGTKRRSVLKSRQEGLDRHIKKEMAALILLKPRSSRGEKQSHHRIPIRAVVVGLAI